ncbi:MAG: hypothetical protein H7177_04315 [Rhizobacter sp.]|nr:hypothetical protein [Bacteriovorax sp.]
MSGAQASDLKNIIQTREYGSCASNNLSYSAMKFYKIPLNEKYENHDLYLRVLLFFNPDGTLSMRSTTQALLGCSGDACSYHPVDDSWLKITYEENGVITIKELGTIKFKNPADTNRGFELTFDNNFPYPHLQNHSFIGGMVAVNFDQNGKNTINICN